MNKPQTYLVYGLGTPIKITGRLQWILGGTPHVITIIKAESSEE